MNRAIWLVLVALGFSLFQSIVGQLMFIRIISRFGSSFLFQAILLLCILLLAIGIWALVAFLNLLRSIGDALDDLVEEMLKIYNLSHADRLFNDSHCLVNRFRDPNASRKLTWVLITDPVTSATMYNALGAVLISAALVFLPGLLAALV